MGFFATPGKQDQDSCMIPNPCTSDTFCVTSLYVAFLACVLFMQVFLGQRLNSLVHFMWLLPWWSQGVHYVGWLVDVSLSPAATVQAMKAWRAEYIPCGWES